MSDPWALATTMPGVETRAAARLSQIGFAHHLFMSRRVRVLNGRVLLSMIPAFPRYVFVRPRDLWRRIVEEVAGVIGFVRLGAGSYQVIDDRVINELVSRTNGLDVFPLGAEPESSAFRRGDRVRITGDGAARGCRGVYECAIGCGRTLVSVEGMGRSLSISVDERDIELDEHCEVDDQQKRRRRRRGGRDRRSIRSAHACSPSVIELA